MAEGLIAFFTMPKQGRVIFGLYWIEQLESRLGLLENWKWKVYAITYIYSVWHKCYILNKHINWCSKRNILQLFPTSLAERALIYQLKRHWPFSKKEFLFSFFAESCIYKHIWIPSLRSAFHFIPSHKFFHALVSLCFIHWTHTKWEKEH